jgi:hypothetical protein
MLNEIFGCNMFKNAQRNEHSLAVIERSRCDQIVKQIEDQLRTLLWMNKLKTPKKVYVSEYDLRLILRAGVRDTKPDYWDMDKKRMVRIVLGLEAFGVTEPDHVHVSY